MKTTAIFLAAVFCFAAAFCGNPAAQSPYAKKVRRTSGGEVYIRIRVKRQKGETCNPTSASMILNHFGVFASASDLQKASGKSDAYKYSLYLQQVLAKYHMKMLFIPIRKNANQSYRIVMRAIDCGLPLQWLVNLLKAPEYDINRRQKAALARQGAVAGHARVLNGYTYNKKSRRLEGFIFTDPWGMRRKEIKLADTAKMTIGFFLIYPEKLEKKVIKYISGPADSSR